MDSSSLPMKRKGDHGDADLKKLKLNSQNDSISKNAPNNWQRPTPMTTASDNIVFQVLDMDYTEGPAVEGMPRNGTNAIPIIRLYGVTENGNSILCNVYGSLPYFYVRAPPKFTESHCTAFKTHLNIRMEEVKSGNVKEAVVKVEIVQKESIMNYHPSQTKADFLKITLALPKLVPSCRKILESSFSYGGTAETYRTFESNLPFVLRYMVDKKIVGGGWIQLKQGDYQFTANRRSTCQLEVDVAHDNVISLAAEGEWAKLAPIRILSFDIECAGRPGVFPEADKDPVIQIANLVTVLGESKPIVRNVFTLNTCSEIVGAEVLSHKTERDLLLAWKNFVREVDPDFVIGYNIANFDLPYLINRANALKLGDFGYLGRIKESKARMKDSTFSSKAYGTRETKETKIDGRVIFDVLQVIQRDYKLRSYTLNSVSAHFLGEQKEEVHHSIITDLQNGTDDDRRRLAVYCLKDAYLPQRLLDKLMIMYNYIEMARVTGVPLSYLLSRGQQIKVISQLYRKANAEDLLIPAVDSSSKHEDEDGKTYEGGFVMDPIIGFYEVPIATLDFSSLYPSIMIAHNICYSTLISARDAPLVPQDQYEISPINERFVKASVKKGILPRILEELLEARKRAKEDLKNEKDPFKRAVLDGRQLALKISANSVYGFTGATVGKLPCVEVSSSVTAYGRQMIEYTKKLVEEKYKGCVVVYGDTDSVMVKFGVQSVSEAMQLGKIAAKEITEQFPPPIKLEFEKVYFPYLLIKKKRYAGLLWTNPEKYDKLDTKGIETVRRDNCPLVKNVVTTCLNKILIERDVEGAKNYTRSIISDLLQNKLDLSLLVITKALSKEGTEYTSKQAHAELARRMKERDPNTAPAIGDRVPYVIIKSNKGAKAYEKAEDPLWVLENNIPLDYQYYLDQQLRQPLIRIFKPLMKDPTTLFVGEHTRCVSIPTPKVGGIVGFVVKKASCVGCRAPLDSNEQTVCNHCKTKESQLYREQLAVVSNYERQFARVWTQCQVCQGSFHQTVLCVSRDCPIFYMRKKVQKDLKDAQELLERFSISW